MDNSLKCLTNKQEAFVTEYVKDFNATQAAIRFKLNEELLHRVVERIEVTNDKEVNVIFDSLNLYLI